MSRRRKSNDLIRIEDAIKVLCRRVCHPGIFCPDSYCTEMWELFEDVERVDAIPIEWINLFNSTPIGGDGIDDMLLEWRYQQEVEAERERDEDGNETD